MATRPPESPVLRRAAALLTSLVLLASCHAHRPHGSSASAPAVQRAPALWGPLEPGPWAVGVRALTLEGGPTQRPLRVTVWTPAASAAGRTPLHYRDYVALSDGGEAAVAGYRALLQENGVPVRAVTAWLDAPVAAVRDVPPAPGRHPLVLVAQGRFHAVHHQAVLCELLASHGYTVATTPFPPVPPPPRTDADALADAQVQAEELGRVLAALRAEATVDAGRVAVVGHSAGARAAFLLALRHPEVVALVSLDGGIANRLGKDWLVGLAGFRPEEVRVPLLHLYQEGDEVVVPDFELLRALGSGERVLLRLEGMRHMDFTSVGAATAVAPELAAPGRAGSAARGYAAAMRATRLFLDAHVRGDARARAALASPVEHLGSLPGEVTLTPLGPVER